MSLVLEMMEVSAGADFPEWCLKAGESAKILLRLYELHGEESVGRLLGGEYDL